MNIEDVKQIPIADYLQTRHIEGWQSKNERIERLNVLYDFPFNTVKEPDRVRVLSTLPARYEICPEFRSGAGWTQPLVLSPLARTSDHTGKRLRKKGTSHTGIL